jgi:hypothetical protein
LFLGYFLQKSHKAPVSQPNFASLIISVNGDTPTYIKADQNYFMHVNPSDLIDSIAKMKSPSWLEKKVDKRNERF